MREAEIRIEGEGYAEVDFYEYGEYQTSYGCTPDEADHFAVAWESGELEVDDE